MLTDMYYHYVSVGYNVLVQNMYVMYHPQIRGVSICTPQTAILSICWELLALLVTVYEIRLFSRHGNNVCYY